MIATIRMTRLKFEIIEARSLSKSHHWETRFTLLAFFGVGAVGAQSSHRTKEMAHSSIFDHAMWVPSWRSSQCVNILVRFTFKLVQELLVWQASFSTALVLHLASPVVWA